MSRNALLLLLLAVIALEPGCITLAPKHNRPKAPVPAEWPSGAAYSKAPEDVNVPEVQHLKWREFITDEKLQKVIELALENNRDLRIAALNVERARAQYGLQRSELLPVIMAAGSKTRQKQTSVTGYISTEPGKPAMPVVERTITERDMVSIGITSWEIDFFGRIRSLKKAALQQYLASEQAQHAAQILLISGVANAYHALAADRENLNLAETTLETQQGIYKLVNRRFECGVDAELAVFQAQTQVDAARGDVARFTRAVAQDMNTLNLLAGTPVPEELLPVDLGCVSPPRDISPGTSSEVLLNRPDVIRSENLLKAANANIGAARAAFFPRILITSSAGTVSAELSGLFDPGTGVWSFSPQIVLPIFDTRIWYAARVSKVDKKLAIAQYEKAIQNSFKEAADALAVRGTVDQQVSAQESLVHAVSETYRLSNTRYTRGVDSYLNVLDAQRSLYAAQQGLVSLRLAKRINEVNLYAVLGGGWDETQPRKQGQTDIGVPKAEEPNAH
ncbi:MAG TPA: efflux transporter outer membrane subunit [Candidatus Hydrogenedentes bacterium]|nr:efflux transporter outer membrane subunit [Candidatus Hydrogenedentota bacterium]